jgi:hypothetical protein
MFYTSVVLFFGFSVLRYQVLRNIALGSLVALTLLFAMISNLVLLPALSLKKQ